MGPAGRDTVLRAVASALLVALPASCGPDRDPFFPDVPTADLGTPDRGVLRDALDAPDAAFDAAADTPVDASRDAPEDIRLDVTALDVREASADTSRDDAPADVPADAPTGPSGRCTPVIDGVINPTEWTDAVTATNAIVTLWTNNSLEAIHVCYDATRLYLGITGSVEPMNAMAVYLDRDFAGGPGGSATGISAFSVLRDPAGSLDTALSAGYTLGASASGFGAEGAWGTRGMLTSPDGGLSNDVGLRLFWPSGPPGPDRRVDFAYAGDTITLCRPAAGPARGACEVSIAWASLFEGPRPPTTTVAMFARINNADGSMSSNQTLPEDNPSVPRLISRVLRLDVRP